MKLALLALALAFPVPSHDLRGPVMAGEQVVVSDEEAGTLLRESGGEARALHRVPAFARTRFLDAGPGAVWWGIVTRDGDTTVSGPPGGPLAETDLSGDGCASVEVDRARVDESGVATAEHRARCGEAVVRELLTVDASGGVRRRVPLAQTDHLLDAAGGWLALETLDEVLLRDRDRADGAPVARIRKARQGVAGSGAVDPSGTVTWVEDQPAVKGPSGPDHLNIGSVADPFARELAAGITGRPDIGAGRVVYAVRAGDGTDVVRVREADGATRDLVRTHLLGDTIATDGFDVAYAVRRCPGAIVQRHPLGEPAPGHAVQTCPVRFGRSASLSRSRRSVAVSVRCPRGCIGVLTLRPSLDQEFFRAEPGKTRRVVITLDTRMSRTANHVSVVADAPDTTGRERSYRKRLRLRGR